MKSLPLLCTLLLPLFSVHAQWPDRHGPSLDSTVPNPESDQYAVQWAADQHIAWKAPLQGEGHSSPVVGEGLVWLTYATADGTRMSVMAIDAATGAVRHDKVLFENDEVEPLGGARGFNNYAAPSCVLAPGAVYVHFGSYGTARLDPRTAEVVWQRRDFPCRHFRGPGSSPVLHGDYLILTFDGIDHQYTVALDAQTGETRWRTPRSTDYGDLGPDGKPKMDGDFRKAYCTPGFATVDGQVEVISVGSKAAQSYDLVTGKELWTVRHKSYNAAIRPIWWADQQLAFLNSGSRGAELIAVRVDPSTRGDVTDSHVVWKRERGNPRFSKPVLYKGVLYQVTDIGILSAIDAATGKELWKKRVGGNFRGSPILIGDLLYLFNEQGVGTIVRIGAGEPEIVAVNEVPAMGTTACPAAANGALYVRGKDHLFKIDRP